MNEQDTTPDPAPATYPPDMRPSQILGMAIDAHRHTRIGGGDPGDPASFIARWLVEQDYVLRSTIPGPGSPAEEITAARRAGALSGLLRGMARKLARHRSYRRALANEYDAMRLELARCRAGWEKDAQELELERVRPVVDAARALVNHPLKPSAHPEFDTIRAWVASLDDGDAAATPQPADVPEAVNADVGALGALIDTLTLDVYAAAHGCEASEVNAGDDGLGDVRLVLADALESLRAVLARRTEETT